VYPATTHDCPDREHNRESLREQENSGMQTPISHKTTRLKGRTETRRIPAVVFPKPSDGLGQEPFPKTAHQTRKVLDNGLERDADEEEATCIRWTLETVLESPVWRGARRVERVRNWQNLYERRDSKEGAGELFWGRVSGNME